jgi:hypothetical protein
MQAAIRPPNYAAGRFLPGHPIGSATGWRNASGNPAAKFTAEFTCQVIEKTIDWPRSVRSIDTSGRPDSPKLNSTPVAR